MPRRSLLPVLVLALWSNGLAHAGLRAVVDGQRFVTAVKRGDYTGPFFLTGTARSRTQPDTRRTLLLTCGNVSVDDVFPKTVPCTNSAFGLENAVTSALEQLWLGDGGTLEATVTSFVRVHARDLRWRIRGTFSGTLAPFENASSPIGITSGHFTAVLHSAGGGD
jgi:hypothetical protein